MYGMRAGDPGLYISEGMCWTPYWSSFEKTRLEETFTLPKAVLFCLSHIILTTHFSDERTEAQNGLVTHYTKGGSEDSNAGLIPHLSSFTLHRATSAQ